MIKLVVIGGSAGSLDVVLRTLPLLTNPNKPPVIIVLHRKAGDGQALIELLASKTVTPVKEAEDKDLLTTNTIYVAPADYHLLIESDHTLTLDYSEKVHYSRPSIDITFQTAADAYGKDVLCILLSGASNDGSAGCEAVKSAGGKVAIQYPSSAEVAYMPQQALERIQPDYLIDTHEIKDLARLIEGSDE